MISFMGHFDLCLIGLWAATQAESEFELEIVSSGNLLVGKIKLLPILPIAAPVEG